MIDNELVIAHSQELEKFEYLFEKPINCNINPKTDPDSLIEFLLEELTNTRKNAKKVIDIGKSLRSSHISNLNKLKEIKKEKFLLSDKLEETYSTLDTYEKKINSNEEQIEYLTREVEELERSLKDSHKENQSTKKEINLLKKEMTKLLGNESQEETKKQKSLNYYKEENLRKTSEIQIESNKKTERIEELNKLIKTLEAKVELEKSNTEILRNQLQATKNDLIEKKNKISNLKTKNHSLKRRNVQLEQELSEEKELREYLNQQMGDFKGKENEKSNGSLGLIDLEFHTTDNLSERSSNRRAEVLSDFFFVPDEHEHDADHNSRSENVIDEKPSADNLVYFITSPSFSYKKPYNMDIDKSCSTINIFPQGLNKTLPITKTEDKTYDQDISNENLFNTIINIHGESISKDNNCLKSRDPRKAYFIKV